MFAATLRNQSVARMFVAGMLRSAPATKGSYLKRCLCGSSLDFMVKPWDHEAVLAAVQQRGDNLQYLSADLRGNREIVLAAVRTRSQALGITGDGHISGLPLSYATAELRADREVVLAAVQREGSSLIYASNELQADRDVVLTALSHAGATLHDASTADREVLSSAVQLSCWTVVYASEELRVDRQVVLAAIRTFEPNANEHVREMILQFVAGAGHADFN